jgi:hypothetical protein
MEVFEMKRLLLALLMVPAILLATAGPTRAQVPNPPFFDYTKLYFRNTTAANGIARELNWGRYLPGQATILSFGALTDSLTFAHAAGGSALVKYDTTAAYNVTFFGLPPTFENRAANAEHQKSFATLNATANIDSIGVPDTLDTTPWVVMRIRADTTSNSWAGGTVFDSLYIGAQYSLNGINWVSVGGTPTRKFVSGGTAATTGLSEDATAIPFLVAAKRGSNAASRFITIPLRCFPALANDTSTDWIIERTMCMCGGYVRFIVGISNDGAGQYTLEAGHWPGTLSTLNPAAQ